MLVLAQIVNITTDSPKSVPKAPVDITFAIRDARGYVRGAEVSSHLRLLSMVEFSFYLSFPVLQIAERKSASRSSLLSIYIKRDRS